MVKSLPSGGQRDLSTDDPDTKPCGWRDRGYGTDSAMENHRRVEESCGGKGQLGHWALEDTLDCNRSGARTFQVKGTTGPKA